MRIETLLNTVHPLKSFVYTHVCFEQLLNDQQIIVTIEPRKNGRIICSGCGRACTGYDHLGIRYFDFVPLWNIPVKLKYHMRRVDCPHCGIRVEQVPWADGKSRITKVFVLFLAQWAKILSWKEVAKHFGTSWDTVFRSVKSVVEYGLRHRTVENVEAIGVDEVQYAKGQRYMTLVYQLDAGCRRLLYIGKDRTKETLLRFFHQIGKDGCARIRYVCSDMWKPYLMVIAMKAGLALHILDRFHIVKHLNDALNQVRVDEMNELKASGANVELLKNTKYCFLKNKANLTDKQRVRLDEVVAYDLKSVNAYLLKESFQLFWDFDCPQEARRYLDAWCHKAMCSRLEPIKKFVRMIRKHQPLILNWFEAKKAYNSGIVEGLNRKVNLVTRKAYGFRSYEVLKIALFHAMGQLPEPGYAHRFCG